MLCLHISRLTLSSAIESRVLDGRAISGTQTVPVSSLLSSLPEKTLEDIKVRACAIPATKDTAALPTINYPLTPGTTLLLGSHVRQSPADVLFGGDEEDTVSALILKSISACSVDARKGVFCVCLKKSSDLFQLSVKTLCCLEARRTSAGSRRA